MKRSRILWAVALIAVGSVIVGGPVLLRADDLPDKVTVDKIKSNKSSVDFPHKAHAAVLKDKCANCHKNPDGKGGLKTEFEQKPADMAAGMKNPFHTQCLECHKTSGKEKAPTKCEGCHK